MTDLSQMMYSMEHTLRVQNQARAERRAEKAEKDELPG